MNNYSKLIMPGIVLLSTLSVSAQAAIVSAVGSFGSNPTASSFLYSHTINQDNSSTSLTPIVDRFGNVISSTNSVAYFGWGIDVWESFITRREVQSHFWFNGVGSVGGGATVSAPYGTTFSLGTFTYTNEETILSGGVVNIDFQLDINVDGLNLAPIEYTLQITNTNNTSYPYDIAEIITAPSNVLFYQNGIQYQLILNGFTRDGGSTYESIAYLNENAQTSAQIYATITQVVVPVPAAIWLMGSGLLAMFGFVARPKK